MLVTYSRQYTENSTEFYLAILIQNAYVPVHTLTSLRDQREPEREGAASVLGLLPQQCVQGCAGTAGRVRHMNCCCPYSDCSVNK